MTDQLFDNVNKFVIAEWKEELLGDLAYTERQIKHWHEHIRQLEKTLGDLRLRLEVVHKISTLFKD